MNSFFVKRSGLLIVIILMWNTIVSAQTPADTAANKIAAALVFHYENYPREKIFIHTNAGVFIAGQTIWYKVYSQAYGKPSAISKIVYVQLTDTAGKVVVQNKLPMADGVAKGNIDLPVKLSSGWYQLRGFTAWMMNFNSDGFFRTKIYVKQLADSDTTKHLIIKTPAKYHIVFYPEGGDPINGHECTIAFKATINNNLPVKAQGEVVDETNRKIAAICTTHDGMGLFSIKGNTGTVYKAIVHFPDSSKQLINLPTFSKEGVAIHINNSDSSFVLVSLAYTGSPEKYTHVTLAAFEDNGTIVTHPLQLSPGITKVILKKELFSTGILRLTVFDVHNIPLAERIVFINKKDMISLKMNTDTLSFNPKGKCSFNIAAGKLPGNFSVSVRDYKTTDEEEQLKDNICSSLLVSSELRGSLYHPGYYFQSDADSLRKQLDLVMLTSGWRRFNWDTVLNKQRVRLAYTPQKSQYLAGKVISKERLDGMKIKLFITNQDSSKYIGIIVLDSAGRFMLPNYEHRGRSKLYAQITDAKNHVKKSNLTILDAFADSLQHMPAEHFTEMPEIPQPVLNSIGKDTTSNPQAGRLLNTVNIRGEKISPTQKLINEHVGDLFRNLKEYTFDFVNNPPPTLRMLDYLMGRIPGLQVIPQGNTYRFSYQGANSNPYFYINESKVTQDDILDLNINDVALVRYLPPPIVFAPGNGGNVGAILVYLKSQADEKDNYATRYAFDKLTFNGYTITREFSSPDYSLPESRGLADNRTTIYWKPELTTDANGTARFSFYNSDQTKGYVVIIQGMDAEGHMGYLYEVIR